MMYCKQTNVVSLVCPSICSGWWHKYVLPVITPRGLPVPTAENLALPSDRQKRGEGGGYLRFFESRINFVPPSGISTKGGNTNVATIALLISKGATTMSRYEDDTAPNEAPPTVFKLQAKTLTAVRVALSKYMLDLAREPRKNLQEMADTDKLLTELEALKS